MPITRAKKEAVLAQLQGAFDEMPAAIFTDFRGVDVAGITALRAKLRADGSRYIVAKRTLAQKTLASAPADQVALLLTGCTGICFAGAEPVAAAKALVDFKKEYNSFAIKGGILDGKFLTTAQIARIATLPSRDVLLAQLFGGMKGPHRAFVGVLAGVMRQFVGTLQAIVDKEQEAPAAA
jgi:large subunit ribosomal protein L10